MARSRPARLGAPPVPEMSRGRQRRAGEQQRIVHQHPPRGAQHLDPVARSQPRRRPAPRARRPRSRRRPRPPVATERRRGTRHVARRRRPGRCPFTTTAIIGTAPARTSPRPRCDRGDQVGDRVGGHRGEQDPLRKCPVATTTPSRSGSTPMTGALCGVAGRSPARASASRARRRPGRGGRRRAEQRLDRAGGDGGVEAALLDRRADHQPPVGPGNQVHRDAVGDPTDGAGEEARRRRRAGAGSGPSPAGRDVHELRGSAAHGDDVTARWPARSIPSRPTEGPGVHARRFARRIRPDPRWPDHGQGRRPLGARPDDRRAPSPRPAPPRPRGPGSRRHAALDPAAPPAGPAGFGTQPARPAPAGRRRGPRRRACPPGGTRPRSPTPLRAR